MKTLTACLLAVMLTAQNQPAQFKSGVELVTIDVSVLADDGTPIANLTPEQFVVRVDGVPRSLASLQFVRAGRRGESSRTAPGEPAPVAEQPNPKALSGRRFVIVVDREGMPAGEGQQMLAAVTQFLDRLGAEDRVAAWVLPSVSESLAFTTNVDGVKQIISRAIGTAGSDATHVRVTPTEAMEISSGVQQTRQKVVSRECSRMMFQGNPQCAQLVSMAADHVYQAARRHSEQTLRILGDLVRALLRLDGQTHVLVVTGAVLQTQEATTRIREIAGAAATSRVQVHALQLPSADWFIDAGQREPLAPEWSNQSAPGGAITTLALQTGGLSRSFVVPRAAVERLEREISAWYVLAFEPKPTERDDKPHRVEVQIKGAGAATVRARQQFRIPAAAPPESEAVSQNDPPPPSPSEPPAPADDPAGGAILERVGKYIEVFEREFATVVAEERYVQAAKPWRGMPKQPDRGALQWERSAARSDTGSPIMVSRRVRSDVLLVQVPNGRWVSFRDAFEVDGRPVRDRDERLRQLFLSADANRDDQLRRINFESSRYNLGVGIRTVNTPTFPLIYLHPRHQSRMRYQLKGTDRIDGIDVVIVEYRERSLPALVGTANGGDILASGRAWVEPATGRVRLVETRLDAGNARRLVRVSYGDEPSMPVLVPREMWEWYENAVTLGMRTANGQFIECLGTYSNFRRFTVSTSVK
jgi:VWFA-related protein